LRSDAAPPLATALELRPTTDEAKLNKLETAWLQVLRNRGYAWVGIQNITLKLGHDLRYTADFWVLDAGRLIAFDTKGPHVFEDSIVKMKATARAFPLFLFVIVKREGGQWVETEIKP